MTPADLFRRLTGLEDDPRSTQDIWQEMARIPGFVDSRNCGFMDAVQSGWYQNDSNELFRGFSVSAEDSVLDIGCGAGGATLFCARRGAHVVFIDAVAEKIESLRARVADTPAQRAEGFVSDSLPLPVERESMSRVIAMEVLEHVPDPAAFLAEMARVGKPGALYLLAVPDELSEKMQQGLAPDYYFREPNHIHIFGREQFARMVSDAGLEVVQRDSYGFFWAFWMLLYWTQARTFGDAFDGEAHDVVQPPYPPLLNDWARLWEQFIRIPEAAPVKQALDKLLPKSQIIIARKPEASGLP
jgi:2-polyprenyl-3-methyl-5-hydroxy-6-metoxy-1,4-benzoquinol methylase